LSGLELFLGAILEANYEAQPRPGVINTTDLVVDQAGFQTDALDGILGKVGKDA
jgi:hypothetical protein